MNYLFFDLECSNCFNRIGKVCEYGYVLTDENFHVLRKDDIPMSPGRGRENRFNLRDPDGVQRIELAYEEDFYYDQPEFPHFYNKLKKMMEDPDVLCFGWSSGNDMLHLHHTCQRYKLEPLNYTCYDIQKLADKYLHSKNQLNLKEALVQLAGRMPMINIQEHLSRDDAFMTMLVFQKLCGIYNKSSMDVLKESDYAKDNSIEFHHSFEERARQKAKSSANHDLYKKAAEEDALQFSSDKSLKHYNISGAIKSVSDNLQELIDKIHAAGGVLARSLNDTDYLLVLDEDNKTKVSENMRGDAFHGEYLLLVDFLKENGYPLKEEK